LEQNPLLQWNELIQEINILNETNTDIPEIKSENTELEDDLTTFKL